MSDGMTPPTDGASGSLGSRLTVVLVVLTLVFGGAWLLLRPASEPKTMVVSAQSGETMGWQDTWKTAGFKGTRGVLPVAVTPELKRAATSMGGAEGLAAKLKAWRESGALKEVSLREARTYPVRTAGALFGQLEEGKAKPVHALEAAWLTRGLCEAAGLSCGFVVADGGVQTPLILSHTHVGVQVNNGPLLQPLGHVGEQHHKVSDELVASWWLLVRAQANRGRSEYKAAHADIALAAKLAPASVAPRFARGVVQLDQGLIDRGLDTCETALAKQEDPFARLFLADVVAAMEKPFKAYQHVQQVLKNVPNLAEAHVSLGLLDAGRAQTAPEKDKQKLLDKASAGFKKALELATNVPGARAGLAQIALMSGKTEEAERLLKEAVDKHGDAQAALVLAELLGMGERSAEAVTMLRKLGKNDDERFVIALVKALAVSGKAAEALKEAKASSSRFPANAQLGLLVADLLRQSGQIKEAILALEPHKKGAEGTRIAAMQAQLYLQNNQAAEAITALEPLVKANPTSKELHLLMIVAYGIGKKPSKQAEAWTTAVKSGVLTWLDVAGVLIETGNAPGAERVLRAGLKTVSVTAESGQRLAVMLAMLLTASDRKTEAIKLRDTLAAKIADAAGKATFVKAFDEAVNGAEAEMKNMATERAAAPTAPAGDAPSAKGTP